MKEEVKKEKPVEKFTKSQLVNSKSYLDHVDLLNALLNDNETYSLSEVKEKKKKYLKGKVN